MRTSYSRWILALNKQATRAHEAWVRRGNTGSGQLVLEDQNLQDAWPNADLGWSRFVRCDLSRAVLGLGRHNGAELVDCTLHHASLFEARMSDASVQGTSFSGADLRLVDLSAARITGGDFDNAKLERTTWTDTVVRGVSFRSAVLVDAILSQATFIDCDFRDADLRRMETVLDLSKAFGTRFERCDFRGCNVAGWRLRETVFDRCQLGGLVGTPVLEGPIEVVDADVSDAGDGSRIVDAEALVGRWTA